MRTATAAMDRAITAARDGDFRSTILWAKQALQFDPRLEQAYLLLGSSCEELGDTECARSAYRRGLEALPDSAALLRERGLLQLQDNDPRAAIQDLERAFRLAPDPETKTDLAFAYLFSEQPQRARILSREAVESKPDCFLCWMGRAEILTRLERHQDAVQAYRTAYELDPKAKDARIGMAQAFFRLGEYEQSHLIFEELVSRDPEDGRLRVQAAQAALQNGSYRAAIEHLEYLSSANPNDRALHQYLLKAQRAAGDEAAAKETERKLDRMN
ncbi:MAG: tetratricopeptide repeat protein [Myxococcota bacterium]